MGAVETLTTLLMLATAPLAPPLGSLLDALAEGRVSRGDLDPAH